MKLPKRPAEPAPYHHGNLREALLAKALAVLRHDGVEHVSLRELARELGVSQSAPYRHFAGKESLLAELATQGFRELAGGMRASASKERSGPATALALAGSGYIRFAVSHPEQYRLMFGKAHVDKSRYPELEAAAKDAFTVLLATIQQGVDGGMFRKAPPMVLAMTAWSLVHGFASLAIDGQLAGAEEVDTVAMADQVIRMLRVGIERAAPPSIGSKR
jgi:AcrR family transcriptional regulator